MLQLNRAHELLKVILKTPGPIHCCRRFTQTVECIRLFLCRYVNIHVFVCVCTYICICEYGENTLTSAVFLSCFHIIFLRQSLFLKLELGNLVKIACQQVSGISSLRDCMCVVSLTLYSGVVDLNPGPHDYAVSTVLADLSPQALTQTI